jgi:hypothetical protein
MSLFLGVGGHPFKGRYTMIVKRVGKIQIVHLLVHYGTGISIN